MIQSSIYLAVLVGLGVLAGWDCLQPVRRQPPGSGGRIRRFDFRVAAGVPALWMVLQTAGAAALLTTGRLDELGTVVFYYAAFTAALPFFVVAGMRWTRAAGTPLLPAVRRAGRGAGRVGGRGLLRGCAELLALAAAALGCVAALLAVTDWKPDAGMARIFGDAPAGAVETATLLGYVLTSAAVSEELIFRHYLLNRLLAAGGAGGGAWRGWGGVGRAMPAILLVTALWTLGHGGMIEPAWLKFAQIGVYGVALGVAQIRLGTEASVTLHLVFNGATPALALWLAE